MHEQSAEVNDAQLRRRADCLDARPAKADVRRCIHRLSRRIVPGTTYWVAASSLCFFCSILILLEITRALRLNVR